MTNTATINEFKNMQKSCDRYASAAKEKDLSIKIANDEIQELKMELEAEKQKNAYLASVFQMIDHSFLRFFIHSIIFF